MSTESKSRSKAYSSTRSAFDELKLEEKACFLLESAAKAVVDGVQDAVNTFSDVFDASFSEAFSGADKADSDQKGHDKEPVTKKKASGPKAKAKTAKAKPKKATASTKAKKAPAKPRPDDSK